MTFLQPLFLWSIAGITVPIAIHLLSRREGKVVKIGSLRHMQVSNTSRFKSLKFNELWLLLARCLMITWLALFLSGAQCTSPQSAATSKWLVIEPGVYEDSRVTSLVDSLINQGFELKTLAEDFPDYEAKQSATPIDYWKLSEDLGRKQDHEIVVLSYSIISAFTNARAARPGNVTWITVDPIERDYLYSARRVGDSVSVRIGHSNPGTTTFTGKYERSESLREWFTDPTLKDSALIESEDTIKVFIAESKSFATDAKVLRAAFRAIEKTFSVHIIEGSQRDAEWTFDLGNNEGEKSDHRNRVAISVQPSPELIVQTSRSEWTITNRLKPEEAVEGHLATELSMLLLNKSTSAVDRNDVRSMPEKMAWAQAGSIPVGSFDYPRTQDLKWLLALLFILTWVAERALALSKGL